VGENTEANNARLDRAEQEMEWLKVRINYLERRAASSLGATQRELEDLTIARDELATTAALVLALSRLEVAENEKFAGDFDGWSEF
jgi:hypothetical protein